MTSRKDTTTMSEEQIRIYAHEYWNWDIIPPMEYLSAVAQYIHDHPTEFRGVIPQYVGRPQI
mgnify:CR=1 FL=1